MVPLGGEIDVAVIRKIYNYVPYEFELHFSHSTLHVAKYRRSIIYEIHIF
jgi:hypothetical protein